MYDNYVFDLYGTLVDIRTEEGSLTLWKKMSLFYRFNNAAYTPDELKNRYYELVNESLKAQKAEQSIRYSHEAYPEIQIEKVFKKLYTDRGVEPGRDLVLHTCQLFRIESIRHLKLYPGVRKFLKAIRTSGKKVYLLSNAQRAFTEYELNALGITELFDGILISSDEGVRKPDIAFFDLLKTRYGLDLSKSIMIGNDATSDIGGATAAGMDALYIRSNISPKDDLLPNCKFTFDTMDIRSVAQTLGFKI